MRGWFPRISRSILRISVGRLARAGDGAAAVRRYLAGHVRQAVAAGVVLVAVAAAVLATTFTGSGQSPGNAAPGSQRVVPPLAPQVVYGGPGKPPVAVLPAAELGGPTWVPVVQSSPGWERVLLPSRPNRATGWIYTGAADGSQLDTRRSAYLVRIDVGARTLSVYDAGQPLGTWTVAVGAPGTPTPTGRTFLLALLAPPHPTYSPLILPLGFHSDTLETYGGGPGTIGVHGWPDPTVFGRAVAQGCVRVPAVALRVLSQVPLGSIVLIT